MDFQSSALVLSWLAILILAFSVAGLIRQIRWLLVRAADPDAHHSHRYRAEMIQGNELPGPDGVRRLVVFTDSECPSCRRLLPEMSELQRSGSVEVAVVLPGERNGLQTRGLPVYEGEIELFRRLRIPAIPFAVLVESDTQVAAAELVGSPARLRALVKRSANLEVGS